MGEDPTFLDDAVVRDERKDMAGHPAIRAWMAETTGKYRVRVVPDRRARGG